MSDQVREIVGISLLLLMALLGELDSNPDVKGVLSGNKRGKDQDKAAHGGIERMQSHVDSAVVKRDEGF